MFVVEQLRDITEKITLENMLIESEKNSRQIVDLSPDAIIITIDGIITLANKEAIKHFDNILGKKLSNIIPNHEKIINTRLKQILNNKSLENTHDYRINLDDKVIVIEVSSSYITFNGKPAVLSVMRDITKRKKELNSAAKIQKKKLQKIFPFPDKLNVESLYIPAKTVSGDYYYLHEGNDQVLIGIIGDVSGKGITAALNISAFNVLFHEALLTTQDPSEIVNILNKNVVNYFGERYIAVCCFSLDFTNNKAKVIGAGINQFITKKKNEQSCERIVRGSFLGMFEDSKFDEVIIDFN